MPTYIKCKPGDVIEYARPGFYIDEGDRVRVIEKDGLYIKVYALKWGVLDAPLDYTEGMWLHVRHFRTETPCMFPEGGDAT